MLINFLHKSFENFRRCNKGMKPGQIVIFRDGVGGPTYVDKVLKLEGPGSALHEAIRSFD